jgi:phosphoribosylaminoimidazole-succinocarboxamide synthase
MEKGKEIVRGKTKVLSELSGQPDVAVVNQLDVISAGNGARRDEFPGKGRLAALTTSRVFRLLNLCGLPTHYVRGGEDDDENEMLVRRCNMIPLEVVVRGVAAGSLTKRRPGIARGSLLVPRVVEFFAKDDAANDPLVDVDDCVERGILNPNEVNMIVEIARLTFDILAHAWRRRDILLVDAKLEFGRLTSGEGAGNIVIADVIDNDSWRLWPAGREDLMLDKQAYRNLAEVTPQALAEIGRNYEFVAEHTGSFPTMRGAMVAALCDLGVPKQTVDRLATALATFGIPITRHITSLTRVPGQMLSMIQQLEVSFGRIAFICLGDRAFTEAVDYATAMPVSQLRPDADQGESDRIALHIAKVFAVDDTVLYGRTLLRQGNGRAVVLQADAEANQPQQKNAALNVPTA